MPIGKTHPPSSFIQKLEALPSRFNLDSVHVVSLLTALMGIINVLSATLPALADRMKLLEEISPLEVTHGSRLATALAGYALLLLSVNLWRRKQVAWLLTLIILAVSVVGHLFKGLDYEEASIAGLLGVGIFALRPHFHARSDFPSLRQGITVLMLAMGFTFAYGITGFYLLDRHFSVNFELLPALRQTILMFIEFSNPGLEPITGFGRYFADSIYVIALGTFGYSFFMLLRPVLVRQPATNNEHMQARAIVEKYGSSSLARFTLFEDKSYFFSPGGSVLAFVAKGGIALVLGDPIGPQGDEESAIPAFKNFCLRNDWRPCFYQVRPDYLKTYKANGFNAINIGQEGIVELTAFTLEGKAGKESRNAVNRMLRLGHRVEIYEPPLNSELLNRLRILSDEWLTTMKGSEYHFSLGWFEDDYVRTSIVAAVYTPEGRMSAFANIISEYQRNEVSLDLMRRIGEIENGTMEFLFVSIFDWAKKKGYATFSLGLSALSGVGEKTGDPVMEQGLRYIYEKVSGFYNFKGLHKFKDKFHPRWESRYLIYPGTVSLPAIAAGLVRAHSGDNFVWAYLKR